MSSTRIGEFGMRRLAVVFVSLLALGALSLVPHVRLHSQDRRPERANAERDDARRPERGDSERQGPGADGPRGGFVPPPPPILAALDTNNDGEISAEELSGAAAALKKLDKNRDGQIADQELIPDFGPGGFPFPGGGPPGGGPPGGGGPARGRSGPGGFGFFGGGDVGERVKPEDLKFEDGVTAIPDHATYQRLSYKGEEVMIDTFLAGLEFVKFTLDQAATDQRQLYFINTNTHRAHMMFGRVAGLPRGRGNEQMKGVLVYRPMLTSPGGEPGLFTFEFEPFDAYSFEMVKTCQDALIGKMPILKGRVGYYPRGNGALSQCDADQERYAKSDVVIYRDEDLISTEVAYLPLNAGKSFGRLRLMELDDRPGPRDVVLYKSLPNEMPRVAGIITAVRQTPLSHVNLRAIQDKVPNAFIAGAAENAAIQPLIDSLVSFEVTADGYSIRAASQTEVDTHFAKLRPANPQTPPRDLSVTEILPLDRVTFQHSTSVGVKAANLATLRTFGFPKETVPDGFVVPFYFYDAFMKHNGFDDYIATLLKNRDFQEDHDVQTAQLKKLRSLIKKGKMTEPMMMALEALQRSFPADASIRCRSSTNNEDLPGFSGAGLYDSFTHHDDEGHLSKSIKQVYASLWNFRAFEEREFYRVDHLATAMAVLVHRNFKDEIANGVAVTDDILYQSEGNYYLNTQVGEDLVTNPDGESIPEEMLLDWWSSEKDQVIRTSNRGPAGKTLLSREHVDQLRKHLGTIHANFSRLYGVSLDDATFAMEIEFKITKQGKLVIKQARPWVFAQSQATTD